MKLPNGNRAVIPMEKLPGYCLNSEHSSGKHKARVFASVLGITAKNAENLRELIAQQRLREKSFSKAIRSLVRCLRLTGQCPITIE